MSITEFNSLKAKAKELGIDTKGMNKAQIQEAINNHSSENDVQEVAPVETPVVEIPVVEGTPAPEIQVAKAKPGRPVVPNSARQQRLAARAEKGEIKRGRPVIEGSARQQRLAKIKAKMEAGIPIKPGRPKMEKGDVVVVINENTPSLEINNEVPVVTV